MKTITWLHLSDLNFRASDQEKKFDIDFVHESLLLDLEKLKESDNISPDFILVTGDISFSGILDEYTRAVEFFNNILEISKLDKKSLFIIPGNHDVNRRITSSFKITDEALLASRESINQILTSKESRRMVFERFNDYSKFINKFMGEFQPFDNNNYFYVRHLIIANKRIAILGLNSAWLTGPNPYRSYSLIGEDQIKHALHQSRNADIRIALMHHAPNSLEEMDQAFVVPQLEKECDFIVHGHVHPGGISSLTSHETSSMIIGAGAIYGPREFANSYNIVRLDLDSGKGQVYIRKYSDVRRAWSADTHTYRNILDGYFQFLLSNKLKPIATPTIPKKKSKKIKKVSLMHLSDLQFGRHHADPGERPPLYRDDNSYDDELAKFKADLKRVKNAYDIKPDIIVVTGDVAEWSRKPEYDVASNLLSELANECDLPRRNVAIVPGNHDINRELCESGRNEAKGYGVEYDPPYFKKFLLYQEFFNNFYHIDSTTDDIYKFDENLYVIFPFPEYGLLFAGLNSCVMESELDDDHYGWISIDQLTRAIKDCNLKDRQGDLLRIALMHHNFRRNSDFDNENLRDADSLLTPLIDAGFKLIFHGHQHIHQATVVGPPGKTLSVLATGSTGLDSEYLPENARRYQYVVIENNTVEVYRRRFEAQQRDNTGKGCWVPDPLPEDSDLFHGGPATFSFDI